MSSIESKTRTFDYIRADGKTMDWLLSGDPTIVYQTIKDLGKYDRYKILNSKLGSVTDHELNQLRSKIPEEGWAKALLKEQETDGLWGNGLYSPKWVSTHYTLLLLMRMEFPTGHKKVEDALIHYVDRKYYTDNGIKVGATITESDVCVTGMVLSMLCHYGLKDDRMSDMIEFFYKTRLKDGGWNCNYHGGDHHSSVHTTLSVLEALDYAKAAQIPSKFSLDEMILSGREFLLSHKLFKSHRTGEPMQKKFKMISFPPRWFYDILKALDYFQQFKAPYDPRMDDAIEVLCFKQRKNGLWPVQNKHGGRVYFDMEKTGSDSRWNTLRALRVLAHFESEQ